MTSPQLGLELRCSKLLDRRAASASAQLGPLAHYYSVWVACTLTVEEDPVSERVHCPYIGRPVGMTQASREWEQPADNLVDLTPVPEWSECSSKDNG